MDLKECNYDKCVFVKPHIHVWSDILPEAKVIWDADIPFHHIGPALYIRDIVFKENEIIINALNQIRSNC